MRSFGSSLKQISNKLLSAEAAVEVVKPGHRVFVGTACGLRGRQKRWPPSARRQRLAGLGDLCVESTETQGKNVSANPLDLQRKEDPSYLGRKSVT
jgi:hypothetical protein